MADLNQQIAKLIENHRLTGLLQALAESEPPSRVDRAAIKPGIIKLEYQSRICTANGTYIELGEAMRLLDEYCRNPLPTSRH